MPGGARAAVVAAIAPRDRQKDIRSDARLRGPRPDAAADPGRASECRRLVVLGIMEREQNWLLRDY